MASIRLAPQKFRNPLSKIAAMGTWIYLSTVLDDYSRYIIAWRLCSTMRAEEVTDTLDMALAASGCDKAHVQHRPRLLSDNGPTRAGSWPSSTSMASYLNRRRVGT